MSGDSGRGASTGITAEDVGEYERRPARLALDAAKDRPADATATTP